MQLFGSLIHSVRTVGRLAMAAAVSFTLVIAAASGQEDEPRSTGLPPKIDWTFNFDAMWGAFGFNDSLYTDPKPEQPSGDLTDDWFEGAIKASLTAVFTTRNTAELYGGLSGVGERTYGAAPSLVGDDANSFEVDDLYVGWRSGSRFADLGEDVLDFTLGRAEYTLGHGMLLWDGGAEGGSRGGYWTNARKAFEFAAIARFKPGNHAVEGFFLDKDDLPEADSSSELWGLNYEYSIGEDTTLGLTYMSWSANPAEAPQRDGLDVYNARAFTAPFRNKKLSFELEYAIEDNGAALDSTAWNALAAYEFADIGWMPKVSYRYAFFEGDDIATPANEAFDGLFTGFYDWGTWWQGEIAGEYFVSNSNLISHQLRVHVAPREGLSTGLILYDFLLDNPASYGPGVTSDDLALELDWYLDWSLNDNFTLSFVLAFAEPGRAVEQSSGRTDSFVYGMFFASYKY